MVRMPVIRWRAQGKTAANCTLAMVLGMLVGSEDASACPGCMLAADSFRTPHPHAIRLAVATRAAIESGALVEAVGNGAHLNDALARAATVIVHPVSGGKPSVVDLFLVDDDVIYRVESHGMNSRVTHVTSSDAPAKLGRVVTTRAVILTMGAGKIRLGEAVDRGLAEIEGPLELVLPRSARAER